MNPEALQEFDLLPPVGAAGVLLVLRLLPVVLPPLLVSLGCLEHVLVASQHRLQRHDRLRELEVCPARDAVSSRVVPGHDGRRLAVRTHEVPYPGPRWQPVAPVPPPLA